MVCSLNEQSEQATGRQHLKNLGIHMATPQGVQDGRKVLQRDTTVNSNHAETVLSCVGVRLWADHFLIQFLL